MPQPTSFKKLSYPMPVSHVVVDGVEVAFSDTGVGEPALVLIHGLGSYMPVWQRNVDALAAAAPRRRHRSARLRQVVEGQLRLLDGVLRAHRRRA